MRLFLFEACRFCFVRGWERTEEEPPKVRRNSRRSHPLLFYVPGFVAVMMTAPSSRGKFQQFLMNSRSAAVMKTVPLSRGEGPEVPDEFLFCCREEDGSVVTWEGSEAPDDVPLLQYCDLRFRVF